MNNFMWNNILPLIIIKIKKKNNFKLIFFMLIYLLKIFNLFLL